MSLVHELDADILILGASFAGVEVVYQLQRHEPGRRLRTMVVDRQREHGYLPLAQERLVGRIDPAASSLKTGEYVDGLANAVFVHDEVKSLDAETRQVTLASGARLRARFVVVALGSVLEPPPDLLGREEILVHKSGPQFEAASRGIQHACTTDADAGRVLVVGGGISGVELAGELAHLRRERPPGWSAPEVTLVGRDERLLPAMPAAVGVRAGKILEDQGVDLRLQTELVSAHRGGAVLHEVARSGTERLDIACRLALWTGGIRPAPILSALGLPRTSDGWLAVGPTLQCFPIPAGVNPGVFACGDAVRVIGGKGRWPTMQRAIECLWQARVVANNILRLAHADPDYRHGVPPLHPHRLHEDFYYGVSVGARSLVVRGNVILDCPRLNTWFRRFLMRRYFARYG